MKAWQGQGGYGAVYRVERVGFGRSQPGALKVSLGLWNWRMEREVQLLSRLSHPSIPRLGQYPACIEAQQDEQGSWQWTSPDFRPLLESNPRLEPPLRQVILQLLSAAPEQRGTAGQVAQALEAAAGEEERPELSKLPGRARAWKPWLALAAVAGGALVLWSQLRPLSGSLEPPRAQVPDTGTAAMGDSVPSSGVPSISQNSFTTDPNQPKRQVNPDAKGRCPGRKQVAFNGGCWIEQVPMTAEDCRAGGYEFREGKCYAPVLELPQKTVPTSEPGEAR